MSEKRFEMKIPINNGNHPLLKDNETGEIVEIVNVEMLIKKMNEQQATIEQLKTELELTANTKLFSRKELERKVEEQQAEIERLQKIIDLTTYQLKVQDRIIQKMEEKE